MGKASRDKGAAGEREIVNLARLHGVRAKRTAQLQAGQRFTETEERYPDVVFLDFPELHAEVKRDEKMGIDAMVKQAEREAGPHKVPIVFWRRNKRVGRVDLPAEYYIQLLRESRNP
jgi:hypothetical protein